MVLGILCLDEGIRYTLEDRANTGDHIVIAPDSALIMIDADGVISRSDPTP